VPPRQVAGFICPKLVTVLFLLLVVVVVIAVSVGVLISMLWLFEYHVYIYIYGHAVIRRPQEDVNSCFHSYCTDVGNHHTVVVYCV
jgi:hypothetical protein